MGTLIIRHQPGTEPAEFLLFRPSDGKSTTQPVTIKAPHETAVPQTEGLSLSQELRWYLEAFLDYPFPPRTERAERVLETLESWGKEAFEALFGQREAWDLYKSEAGDDLTKFHLDISSDDPAVLAWPWEALFDKKKGYVAHQCQIVRKINDLAEPPPLSPDLPQNQLNILLITARPYAQDVGYRSISRSLVEIRREADYPVNIHLLRPPTMAALKAHLRDRPHTYHIVHFDGHGGYGVLPQASPHTFKGPQGMLIFEDDKGSEHPIEADDLSTLLSEHRIPMVVMNACQSGMVTSQAEDPFASVAASLLKAGVHSVVAMAYSLYVSAAHEFLPGFYRTLFRTGDVEEATRVGRQDMLQRPQRVSARGRFPLQDWLVPVVYQQRDVQLTFKKEGASDAVLGGAADPLEGTGLKQEENPYGMIGRDRAVLAIERAMRRPPAGILIHGMGGIGKTTLAIGFIQWLAETQGLSIRPFWFGFNEIYSAEHVINELGQTLFGTAFGANDQETRLNALVQALREHAVLIVWDNFESVCGIDGTEVTANLSPEDQDLLRRFLGKLRGGKTKVLITSRSTEPWLGSSDAFSLHIGGLQGEERWAYCEAILNDRGLHPNRDDEDLVALLNLLEGHPLGMRVMLQLMERHTAAQLKQALQEGGIQVVEDDPVQARLYETLHFVENDLPERLHSLLIPLGLHEKYINRDVLTQMAERVGSGLTEADVAYFFQALSVAGLLHAVGTDAFAIHPVLTGYLRNRLAVWGDDADVTNWQGEFFLFMTSLAAQFAERPLHEQRGMMALFGASLFRASQEAARQGKADQEIACLTMLAVYALNARDFAQAEQWYRKSLAIFEKQGNEHGAAITYHQLGIIAEEQRDFAQAEQWYRKSLAIEEKQGNEHGAAITYHQLGRIAQEQRDFAQAEQWCRKSLAIEEKQGNEHGVAITYHLLGRIAQGQRDFAQAEQWYSKSLAIKEKQGNEQGAASTYHQLGIIAQEQRDFAQAEQWYRKSLAIKEKQGNEHGAAITYHQLGIIAEEQRDFAQAEQWYRKSLAIKEKQGNEHGAAITYHQLGIIAEEQRDFAQAEQWCRKSLAIFEKQGNEHGAAGTYHQLGRIAQEQRDFAQAEQWYRKSLAIFEKQGNEHGAAGTYHQLGRIAQEQRDFAQAEQWYRKSLAIKEKQGNEQGAAITYHQLGIIAQEQRDFAQAEQWYRKSLAIKEKQGNEHGAAGTYHQLGIIAEKKELFTESAAYYVKALLIYIQFEDPRNAQIAGNSFRRAYDVAPDKAALLEIWQKAGLPPLPDA